MGDLFAIAEIDPEGALLLVAVAALAGVVRGFSGFGSALIYIPLAATVLPPIWVLITLTVMDLIGPVPNLPAAVRAGRPRQVIALGAVAAVALVPGLWALDRLGGDGFRWLVSLVCLATVGALVSGWRWRGGVATPVIVGAGTLSGFLGGASGLAGPPVILTYMAAPLPVAVIRANILMYLVLWDGILLSVLWMQGRLSLAPVILGIGLILPYLAANVIGARFFHPDRERIYRITAYAIVTAVAVSTLPIWSLS